MRLASFGVAIATFLVTLLVADSLSLQWTASSTTERNQRKQKKKALHERQMRWKKHLASGRNGRSKGKGKNKLRNGSSSNASTTSDEHVGTGSVRLRGATRSGTKPHGHTGPRPYRMQLTNHDDIQYSGRFSVGGQVIDGIIDTGSFELMIFAKQCKLCGDRMKLYDHALSSDYIPSDFESMHSFGSGDTWSHEAFDLVRFGPDLAVQNQSFWEVIDSEMPALETATFQAIVGLGPNTGALSLAQSYADDALTDMNEAKARGELVSVELAKEVSESIDALERTKGKPTLAMNLGLRRFSICIGQRAGDSGQLVWNDEDPRLSSSVFAEIPLIGDTHWGVEMSDVKLTPTLRGSSKVDVDCGGGNSCAAVVDSGTSLLGAPKESIKRLEDALERLGGDCSNIDALPELSFKLGGQEFSLPPESYVGLAHGNLPISLAQYFDFGHEAAGAKCQVLLMSVDSETEYGPMWILGLPFFKQYYTTFEFGPTPDARGSLFVAPVGDQCKPGAMSLLHSPRQPTSPMNVDASKLRVPSWLVDADAAGKKRYRL